MRMHRCRKGHLQKREKTIMKGNGKFSWCGVSLPVFRKLGKVLNDVWHSAVINFGCVSSRILCIKLKFSSVKVCVGVGYSPNEGDGEEREMF